MYTTEQRRNEARALAATLDRLTREPKRFSPSAPWIIPATMVVVAVFALACLIIKFYFLFRSYLKSKHNKTKKFALSEASSPDIPTTPEDQASMATTASMKGRGSFRLNSTKQQQRSRRTKPPPVSLYQIKSKQSPSSSSKLKSKAALKAISRAARNDANKSLSRDSSRQINDDNSDDNDINNADDSSPTNLSQHSDDITGEISGIHPEVHIVQIRDLGDNVQHSEPQWRNSSEVVGGGIESDI